MPKSNKEDGMENNFKASEFFKDIGLDLIIQNLERSEPKSNIHTFTGIPRISMSSPESAVYVHIQNLIATYGLSTVKEVIEALTKE